MSRRRAHIDFSSANIQSLHRALSRHVRSPLSGQIPSPGSGSNAMKNLSQKCVCTFCFLRCYPVSFQSSASLPGTLSQHAVKILQNSEISLLSLLCSEKLPRSGDRRQCSEIHWQEWYLSTCFMNRKIWTRIFTKRNWKIFSRISTHKLVRCFSVLCVSPSQCLSRELESFFLGKSLGRNFSLAAFVCCT